MAERIESEEEQLQEQDDPSADEQDTTRDTSREAKENEDAMLEEGTELPG
jgi:hypothetical protein